MTDVPIPRPRRRGEKSLLSRDAVVEAGLAVLKEDGIEAVTMRRVADRLKTGPASIYRWVADRAELVELMLDRVMGEVPLERPDPARWREQIHALMDQTVAALSRYPGIALTGLANVPTGGSALKIRESMLAVLLAGGVDPQSASWAIDTLPLLAFTTALETDLYTERGTDLAAKARRVTDAYMRLPLDDFPTTAANLPMVLNGTQTERFSFAIDTYLNGLPARQFGSE